MARPKRIEYKGAIYHIIARGIEKSKIFSDKEDKELFIEILRGAKKACKFNVYGYCILDNHFHLQIETPEGNLVRSVTRIQRNYSIRYNVRKKRSGHVFEGRYKAYLIEKEKYFLDVNRYLHLNPLRAGIVKDLMDYEWSSYRDYITNIRNSFVDIEFVLGLFGKNDRERRQRYREYIEEKIESKYYNPLSKLYGGWVLGSKEFVKKIKDKLKKEEEKVQDDDEIREKKYLKPRISIEDIVKNVAEYYGVEENEIREKNRKNERPTKIAIHLIRKYTDLPLKKIGEYFGKRYYSTISCLDKQLKEKIENDSGLIKEIEELESRLGILII